MARHGAGGTIGMSRGSREEVMVEVDGGWNSPKRSRGRRHGGGGGGGQQRGAVDITSVARSRPQVVTMHPRSPGRESEMWKKRGKAQRHGGGVGGGRWGLLWWSQAVEWSDRVRQCHGRGEMAGGGVAWMVVGQNLGLRERRRRSRREAAVDGFGIGSGRMGFGRGGGGAGVGGLVAGEEGGGEGSLMVERRGSHRVSCQRWRRKGQCGSVGVVAREA